MFFLGVKIQSSFYLQSRLSKPQYTVSAKFALEFSQLIFWEFDLDIL